MKKIERIILKGFQSHMDTELRFSPQVSIMIGPTDSGKSAALRAIKWVYRNKPQGDFFINDSYRESGKTCEVTIQFDDGSSITRRKGKSINEYVIGGTTFSNFEKTGIPKEVLTFLEVPLGYDWKEFDLDLNFGGQFDPTFLLTAPARTPAIIFGRLIGLDSIDDATKLTATQKREYQQKSNVAREDLGRLNALLKELPDTQEADWLLEETSKLHFETYAPLTNQIKEAIELRDAIAEITEYIRGEGDRLKLFETIPHTLNDIDRCEKIGERRQTLVTLNNDLQSNAKAIETFEDERSKLLETTPGMLKDIDRYEEIGEKWKNLTTLNNDLQYSVERIETIDRSYRASYKTVNDLAKTINEMLSKEDVCPLSGGEFYETCKKLLKEERSEE